MSDISLRRPVPGLSESNRARLSVLHRALPGPFTADDAARALGTSRPEAARLVGYLASKGWLSRIRRGLFTVVPLEAEAPASWRADPWLVAARVFEPCYIGGWSACEHWGLTEQLFRSIVVVTTRPQRAARQAIQGSEFLVAVRQATSMFGTRPVWRGRERVGVSDPSRTVIDVLDDPGLGGGIRHVADVLVEYLDSPHRDDELLIRYGDQLGNRAVFKRLGYLVEQLETDSSELVTTCFERRSAGLAKLDPTIDDDGRITNRWRLRINATIRRPAPQ
jgi:predicted transcriptional regulator of viral defense system